MNTFKKLHTIGSEPDTDKIPTDGWKAYEYDMLDDLHFKLNDFDMNFDYAYEKYDGSEFYLGLCIFKDKDEIWNLEIRRQKEQTPKILKFKNFENLIDTVHKIFNKY